MAFIGNILQKVVKINKNIVDRTLVYDSRLQGKTLLKLLKTAAFTDFGKKYGFENMVYQKNFREVFRDTVPIFDYNKMFEEWWHRTLNDEYDVTWPGRIKHFALTSGTSESTSKRIPVSPEMISAINRTSLRQSNTIVGLDLPAEFYEKSVLMVGGSAKLTKVGMHYEGDLSGILASRLPVWFHKFYKPGINIGQIRDWEEKLDVMTKRAHTWDIGIVAGVPAWVQILMERVIAHNQVDNIHDVWPNLKVFFHGGVSFAPYRKSFEKLLGKPIHFLETYLASEGFFAFEAGDNRSTMQLVLDKGIFYEFIPFNEQNFDENGNLLPDAQTLFIDEVKEQVDYALLISTCSGTWRYLIGDTIRFTSLKDFEIIITGRTKHFLSLCGEHLSVDNMNQAIRIISEKFNVKINEYTVCGEREDNLFAHRWYIGVESDGKSDIDKEEVMKELDQALMSLNDDYITERKHALKSVHVELIPTHKFYDFLKLKGKFGGQNKFPRVLKGDLLVDWKNYISK
jgi:hypothetical protein